MAQIRTRTECRFILARFVAIDLGGRHHIAQLEVLYTAGDADEEDMGRVEMLDRALRKGSGVFRARAQLRHHHPPRLDAIRAELAALAALEQGALVLPLFGPVDEGAHGIVFVGYRGKEHRDLPVLLHRPTPQGQSALRSAYRERRVARPRPG